MTDRVYIQVPTTSHKSRLEDFLFLHFAGLSRMYLRKLVRDGHCEVNGRNENVGYRLRANDLVEIDVDLSRENSMRPQDIPLRMIYEDEHLAVVDKPAGMLVHPTNSDKSGTLLNALAFHFNRKNDGEVIRPGLIHRLDKETSGLMVIAKTMRSHRSLSRQFQRKYVEKRYLALVDGAVEGEQRVIDIPVGRISDEKRWDTKPGGKHAETRLWVRERYRTTSLLELEPVTGRTNQLRIHCAAIGHPIIGDTSRGGREFGRLCLHAYKLSVRHPISQEDMNFISEMPELFSVAVAANSSS